ncbi:MAG: PP2C family protein-serine/threonine phosphatase [Gemmataceae bacterium]
MSLPKVQFSALTDVGVKRSHNQDACAALPAADDINWKNVGHIFVVADGMGGHAVGEKASAKAVRDIPLTFQKHVLHEGVRTAIRRAFVEANAGIFEIGQNNPEFQGMGTTGTALFLRPDGAWVGHVGDSRTYRIRKNIVEQLTFDHSWVWEIARRQGIDPDTLGDFKKNVIIRSLGPDAEVEVDVEGPYPVEPGDMFLLCSDGLSNLVTGDELGSVASVLPPDEASKFLIELANARGGPDNISCIIVKVPGESKTAETPAFVMPSRKAQLRQVLKNWDERVPWSYTFLGLGIACVLSSIVFQMLELTGVSVGFFIASAVLILLGIVGLLLHLRKQPASGAANDSLESSESLHVYKTYVYEINKPIHDRFEELETALQESLKQKPEHTVDWKPIQRMSEEAMKFLNQSDYIGALRSRCRAVQMLAGELSKDRNKEEAFQPNWTKPTRN